MKKLVWALFLLLVIEGCGPGGKLYKSNQLATTKTSQNDDSAPEFVIPGPSEKTVFEVYSTVADPKVLKSKNGDKTIVTQNLPVEDVQVKIAANSDKSYYVQLKSKMPTLPGAPVVTLRGDIRTDGRFKLYPEQDYGAPAIVGFGECNIKANTLKEAVCSSMYIEVVAKLDDKYFYQQIEIKEIVYEKSSKTQNSTTVVNPRDAGKSEVSEPVPSTIPNLVAPSIDSLLPTPVLPPLPPGDGDDESEDCSNPKMKGSLLCEAPGRRVGNDILIEQVVKTTYEDHKKEELKKSEIKDPEKFPKADPIKTEPSTPAAEKPTKKMMQAFDSYWSGHLEHADNINPQSDIFIKNQLDPYAIYGTTSLVNFVNAFTQQYLAVAAPQKAMVSNLSEKNGGPLRVVHVSHRNGLDADIGYPSDNNDKSTESMFVSVVPGLGSPGHPRGELKVKETWDLFKWIVKNAKVDLILVHPLVKNKMCAQAKKMGEFESEKVTLTKLARDTTHYNHFHVRLECQDFDRQCAKNQNPRTQVDCSL